MSYVSMLIWSKPFSIWKHSYRDCGWFSDHSSKWIWLLPL